jgi:hypothetical protein
MRKLLFVPLCLVRGFCLPVLVASALVASVVYVASKTV